MKISLEWLAEYLPGPLEAVDAAQMLTSAGFPVENIEKYGNDSVLDVEVTSNRPDCLSYLGIARELAALLNRPFRDVEISPAERATPASEATSVRIDSPSLCPHYTARLIRGVSVRPSPPWLAHRLEAMGLRPINNVVDVTNYVLFEMGQPLHAFDFEQLRERRIIVRNAAPGEKLATLDGRERELRDDMLVIADAVRPVAIAGVMGGRETEVTGATRAILLESARFDPLSVRRTSRAVALRSESSYRFERGLDPTLPERASQRAAQLILQTAGGELASGLIAAGSAEYRPNALSLRLPRLNQVLGVQWPVDQVVDALTRLRFAPRLDGDRISVTIPSDRLDLNLEIDLVEEVARLIGYDNVPVRDEISVRLTAPDPATAALEAIHHSLSGAGYYEALTFSFVSDALADDFAAPENEGPARLLRAESAVRKADASLRPSLLPGLLESARRNESAGIEGPRLFEIGSTFWEGANGEARELRQIGLVGGDDVREIRGVVEAILRRLDAQRDVRVVPVERRGLAAGAAGRIEWGGETAGYLGKLDRSIAEKLSLRHIPPVAELSLPVLLNGAKPVPQLQSLPRFPPVRRDLSVVLPESAAYQAVESVVRSVRPPMLEDLEYVTTYRGKPLEAGTKSVTITLIFRSPDETLTGEQVEASVQTVTAALREKLGAALRV